MRCKIREDLEEVKKSFDAAAYRFRLGSEEFDRCLAGGEEVDSALADHKAICPVCSGRDVAVHAG
jgi:hypothetical protein